MMQDKAKHILILYKRCEVRYNYELLYCINCMHFYYTAEDTGKLTKGTLGPRNIGGS